MTPALYDNFKKLVTERTPLIDVRAPIEFEKGAFPTAVNLPLMNNKERELVGIRYKNNGNQAALKLGHELVSNEIKEQRIKAWIDYIKSNPNTMLYCFRGGQRSAISQQWLHESGFPIMRLKGGYKAFRNYLLQELESIQNRFHPIMLGGYTGSGKTLLLQELNNCIDLEKLAKHRGSTFGRHIDPQPTQINFENQLAFDLLQKLDQNHKELIFEDESRHIGQVHLPNNFFNLISQGELIVLETPFYERVEITFNEYVTQAQAQYNKKYPKTGFLEWADDIQKSLNRIQKKLGGKRYKELTAIFKNACNEQKINRNNQEHKAWIEELLKEYYDPMYDYQLIQRAKQITFRGNKNELKEYLQNKQAIN